jgi:hypothetical protein
MRAVGSTWVVWAAVVAASLPWTLPVEAATKAEQARAAAKLVDETLNREAKEGVANRAELLRPALQEASNCDALGGRAASSMTRSGRSGCDGTRFHNKRPRMIGWPRIARSA